VVCMCAMRIREVTLFFLGEGGVFISDTGGGVGMDRCISLITWLESADSYNRRDRIQVVRIDALEAYQLLSSTALLSLAVR